MDLTEDVKKFSNPLMTLKAAPRAQVKLTELKTLWFNTGTRCNLTCENCYIESSPSNDRLVYLTLNDVIPYLEEIKQEKLPTTEIAFTGGEPFLNPQFIQILEEALNRGFKVLILTNGYKVMDRKKQELIELNRKFPKKMLLRVSLDHYTKEVHEKERGPGTFEPTLKNIQWINQNNIPLALAARSLIKEKIGNAIKGYQTLFNEFKIPLDYTNPEEFVIFPEMDGKDDTPEISQECFSILKLNPDDLMCAHQRMVVKRKGQEKPVVLPCTLLAYDEQFELGETLSDSKKTVFLNHSHCAKFCVLGGASCSIR